MMNTEIVQYLNFLTKQYDGVTQLIAKTKQRICSLPGHDEDEASCDTALRGDGKSEGLPVSEPYAGAIMGHTNIVKPPYWESEAGLETHSHRAFPAAEMRV